VIKEPPSLTRVLAMAAFALTCFGLLIFLWLSFGGPIPLKPQQYRLSADVPEAANLADQADVRMSGITIGKVISKSLDKHGVATKVTMNINPKYAPLPKDIKFILRQKTLLGETYAELAPGNPKSGYLKDGATIPRTSVEKTVELDEIFSAFNKPTRTAFQKWVAQSALAIKGTKQNPDSTAQDLNDALGNLGPFASDASDVLGVLDRQKTDLSKLIRNTGVVFGAISERDHALRNLITNSDQVFSATDKRDAALRQIFQIFPTFLDESKATLARLKTFSNNTKPLAVDLQPVARKLNPTVKDLADLSPNLRALFRDLNPLINVSKANLPQAARFLDGASPVLGGLHSFLQELNPVLSYLNYDARSLTAFLSNGGATANYRFPTDSGHMMHALAQFGVLNTPRDFGFGNGPQDEMEGNRIPKVERANAYPLPENYLNAGQYGVIQSFSCANVGGNVSEPNAATHSPPCHEQGVSAWDGKRFPRLNRGEAPNQKAPDDPGVEEAGQPKHYK
jgi:phospholipid/cholesterol/gamma-HCH transport system substrate-binding protein